MKGWRNNGDAMGALLATRTSLQRQAIVEAYASLYKRDMHKDIEAKMSGDFRDLVRAMLQPMDEFLCCEVLRTIKVCVHSCFNIRIPHFSLLACLFACCSYWMLLTC